MPKRIIFDRCVGTIIDVQDFFLSQIDQHSARPRIETNIVSLARLLGYFRIPILVTLEAPADCKGALLPGLKQYLGAASRVFEKNYFDLTKEGKIRSYLQRLNKNQVVIAGCETDVCVLQSCLGLLACGYQVYVVEDLLFSSSEKTGAAVARMQGEGAVFITYKSLYYELIEGVETARHFRKLLTDFGPFPNELSDCAE